MNYEKKVTALPWDTKEFGFSVAEIYADNTIPYLTLTKLLKETPHKLIYIKSTNIIPEFEKNLFRDERIIYYKPSEQKTAHTYPSSTVSRANINDFESLRPLAIASGIYSRFKQDPLFPDKVFEHLYHKWLEQSLCSDFAKEVLTIRNNDGKPQGILTYNETGNTAKIGLIAVDNDIRGNGKGTLLMREFENDVSHHITGLEVTTQGINRRARSFYEHLGYTIRQQTYIYHYWQ